MTNNKIKNKLNSTTHCTTQNKLKPHTQLLTDNLISNKSDFYKNRHIHHFKKKFFETTTTLQILQEANYQRTIVSNKKQTTNEQ